MSTWIQTFTGKVVDLETPTPESISIEDIAHATARLCRYTGHTFRFYSVAEHCIFVSIRVRQLAQRLAPESGMVFDVSLLRDYKIIEDHWQRTN